MSELLAKALEGLVLNPGETYRARVNGRRVELRVLEDDDEPTPELAEQVMLQPWAWFPYPREGVRVRARPGPRDLSPPPEIPDEETGE